MKSQAQGRDASPPSTRTEDHPLWGEFQRWYRATYGEGPVHGYWTAFLAGATAVGYGQTNRKLVVNQPPQATTSTVTRERFSVLSDMDLLKEVVDWPDGDSRVNALGVLTDRIRSGSCDPKIALIKGFLTRVNMKDSTQDARRTVCTLAVEKYNLEVKLWY